MRLRMLFVPFYQAKPLTYADTCTQTANRTLPYRILFMQNRVVRLYKPFAATWAHLVKFRYF